MEVLRGCKQGWHTYSIEMLRGRDLWSMFEGVRAPERGVEGV